MGRVWAMPAGNLAASCLVRLQPGESKAAELAFVAALALHDAVAALVDPARLQLKWPNDLLLDGAKLSGILLEREGEVVILGIGVNLAAAPPLPDRATIALADAGVAVPPRDFLAQLAATFDARRAQWRAEGLAPLRLDWLARAHPPGTPLWVVNGETRLSGRFRDIAADGALLLDGDDGALHQVHAGDVWQAAPGAGRGEG